MHYTAALEHIQKHLRISQLKEAGILGLWIMRNTFLLDEDSNMIGLNLSENNLQDISPLKDLTSLTWLYLDNNKIQDISQIKTLLDLPKLRHLSAFGNPIKDIPSEKLGKSSRDNSLPLIKDYLEQNR